MYNLVAQFRLFLNVPQKAIIPKFFNYAKVPKILVSYVILRQDYKKYFDLRT
jgi:hypothetical protein